MQTQIERWGNSLAVRIPQPLAHALSLTEGATVEIETTADGRIVLRPKSPATPSLAERLAAISSDNLPDESFDDAATGSERL